MANVDESPAYLGGKDNGWRRLDLTCKSFSYMLPTLSRKRATRAEVSPYKDGFILTTSNYYCFSV